MSGNADMESLPHWARVAFAVRCARGALPLFCASWPNALPCRLQSLESAISLAEQSASDGKAIEGLRAAAVSARITAGASLVTVYNMQDEDHEPYPPNVNACHIACFATKSAEWAAMAAKDGPTASVNAALEAFTFTRQAADAAEAPDVLELLECDFKSLHRVAARGRWTDATPVPPAVFSFLDHDSHRSSWWKLW